MKTLFKLFIVAAFTIISAGVYAQSSDILEHRGKIVQMTTEDFSILDYSSGEVLTSRLWNRDGSFVQFKVGDELTFIVVNIRSEDTFKYLIAVVNNAR